MSSPKSLPPNYNQSDRRNLLPQDKLDTDSIEHLESLGPAVWAPLIACSTPTAPAAGLLDWLCDINWPVAYPITQLLLTCVNDLDNREKCGHYLVDAVSELFMIEDDWEWIYWVLAYVVCKIEDKEYVKREFGDSLKAMRDRAPKQDEEDWGFKEEIAGCLGEEKVGDEERLANTKTQDVGG